jgi:hypothetical protein
VILRLTNHKCSEEEPITCTVTGLLLPYTIIGREVCSITPGMVQRRNGFFIIIVSIKSDIIPSTGFLNEGLHHFPEKMCEMHGY